MAVGRGLRWWILIAAVASSARAVEVPVDGSVSSALDASANVFEALARQELVNVLWTNDPVWRDMTRDLQVELRPRFGFSGGCRGLGNPAAAGAERGRLIVELCASYIHLLASAVQGLEVMQVHRSMGDVPPFADQGAAWQRRAQALFRYMVRQDSAIYAAVVLQEPATLRAPSVITICSGLHVAWLVSHGREPSACLAMSDEERAVSRKWAWKGFARLRSEPASESEIIEFLQWDFTDHVAGITRFFIAHELGHHVFSGSLQLLTRLGVPDDLLRELEADYAGLKMLDPHTVRLYAHGLNLYWTELARLHRSGAPDPIHVASRSFAIEVSSACLEGVSSAGPEDRLIDRLTSEGSPLAAKLIQEREHRREVCRALLDRSRPLFDTLGQAMNRG